VNPFSDLPSWFVPLAASLFGLVVGSFLNVCIVRLPKEQSVVAPRSHCPACGHMIPWYENIPVFSYLLLGGKCSQCQARISPLYWLIELATGVMFAGLAARFGPSLELLKYLALGSLMLALTVIDLRDRILPDELTRAGLGLGVVFSAMVPIGDGTGAWLASLLGEWPPAMVSIFDSLLGAAAGSGALALVREGYYRWRGVEGMGFGDLKLMAAVGAFLGPKLALLTIFLGSFSGALIGGAFILLFRRGDSKYELPFGSFLGLMALGAGLWGKEMLDWYFHLMS
jgi:leader peptidase (prepilin peptidase)/N-methyltransferase